MTKKILITTSSFKREGNDYLSNLEQSGFDLVFNPFARKLNEQEISRLVDDHDPIGMIAGVEPLTAEVIRRAGNLKVISRCGVGTDSVDIKAAEARDIRIAITPGGPTAAVSELTMSLILAACRRVVEADRTIRKGEWAPLMGRLLASQTVGLIGFGRIGQAVAVLCQAFGAKVVASDPGATQGHNIPLVDTDVLLRQSDIVSLHVPLMDDTRGFMNERRLTAMKPGSILINAARGGLVDEEALHKVLKSGHLAAAALDCFVDEPYQGPLAGCPTVILTAHMGSYAREARAWMEQEAAKNLVDNLTDMGFISGQP